MVSLPPSSRKNNMSSPYPPELVDVLNKGGAAVIRTDTIYGIVGRADNRETVERIYQIKGRTPEKSPIVLIANPSDMFDVYDHTVLATLRDYWPGPNSIILPSQSGPSWITRGNESIAYRLPANAALQELLHATGPLIAPSANPEGLPPATTIEQAKQFFGDAIDCYCDGGTITDTTPSSLYLYNNDVLTQLR